MSTQRDEALRRELVAVAAAALYAQRTKPRTLIAGAAAIALASALTGGAVSAVALGAGEESAVESAPVELTAIDIAKVTSLGSDLVTGRAELFGNPFIVSGRGDVVVELGPAPEGATSVAVAVACLEEGSISSTINGEFFGRAVCELNAYGGFGGSGSFSDQVTDGENTIELESTGNFVLWASWAQQVERPAQSQAQVDALADGTVTAEEYDAGFDRFAACMEAAGHALQGVAKTPPVYHYAMSPESVSSGTQVQCYEAEFMMIDSEWQILNAED